MKIKSKYTLDFKVGNFVNKSQIYYEYKSLDRKCIFFWIPGFYEDDSLKVIDNYLGHHFS